MKVGIFCVHVEKAAKQRNLLVRSKDSSYMHNKICLILKRTKIWKKKNNFLFGIEVFFLLGGEQQLETAANTP